MMQLDFLGPEFLTWLYFQVEEIPELSLGKRVTLKPLSGDDRKVTIATPHLDDSGELLQSVRAGYYVDSLALEYVVEERVHAFTLNASDGSFSGVKTNGHGVSTGESEEADLMLRMSNLDEIEALVEKLFAKFLEVRLGQTFVTQEISAIREIVLEGLKAKLIGPLPSWKSAEVVMQA